MAATLYASEADLKAVLGGTDSGIGTASQLSDTQLTLALTAASNQVSMYAGNVWDSSVPAAVPPPALHDLTLDLAAFYATATYLKNKAMVADSPVRMRYERAIQMLNDVRDGKLRIDPVTVGGIGEEVGVIINRIPPVFTGDDSNTRLNPYTGTLESDVPIGPNWAPRADDYLGGGPVYQG